VIVTVANRKGGVGKTTTSVFLAHAIAEATGAPCALVDADPQASAAHWARLAAEAGHPMSVQVLAQPTTRLGVVARIASNLVIDTPPGESELAEAAIALGDFVLVPTTSSSLDLAQVRATVAAAARSGKPAAVLLTRTRRTRSVAAAEQGLRSDGIRVLRTHVALREALAMAYGRPVRQLHGYELATAELLGALPEQPYSIEAVRQRAGHAWAEHRPSLSPNPSRARLGEQRAVPQVALRPIGLGDEEIIERLKRSVARLAT
jgi:chromosome partitioning protein